MAQLTEKQKKKLREQLDNSRRSGVLKGNLESNNQSVQQVQKQRKEDIYVSTSAVPKKIQNKGVLSNNNTQITSLATVNRTDNNTIKQKIQAKYETNMQQVTNKKSAFNDIKNIASNFGLGVKKAGESSLSYMESMSNKSSNYKRYNQYNAKLNKEKEQLENLKNGKTIEGANITQKALPGLNDFKQQTQKQNEANPILLKAKENSQLESPVNEYLNRKITADEQKIQKNIENSSNAVSKKIAELVPSIGQSVTGMAVSAINPGLGLAFWQTSAGGDYIRDAKARGMNDEDALKYGTIMGSMESATEWVGAELTKGVGKAIAKGDTIKGLKALGLDIGENFFEEAIMEPLQETVATMTGGKETANWSNMMKRMLQNGIDGALTSIIMGGASAGVGKATKLIGKMQEGETISQEEIADTLKEINKQEEIDIEKVLVNSFGFGAQDLYKNTTVQEQVDNKLNNIVGNMSQYEAGKLINNSNLSEEQKASLKRVAEKHNMTTEEVQNLINNPPNNEVINSNQQITQEQNKIAENGNVEPQNTNPYRNTAKANKLIKEKNEKIRLLNNDLKNVTSPEAKEIIKNQIQQLDSDYNSQIQKLYDEIDIANNTKISYNNMQVNDKKNVPIEEVLQLQNRMGYRTEDEINSIREYVKKNGLENTPIELVRKNDGTFEIEDGNHRLLIAKELGMKEIPIKIVESWENIGIKQDVSSPNVKNDAWEEIYNANIKNNSKINGANVKSGIVEGRRFSNNNKLENGRTRERDDKISKGESQDNQYTSNSISQKNFGELDKSSSFSMQEKHIDKYNKYKENIIKRNEKTINNLISNKNDSMQSIENSIKEKQKLLNSKKNKDTKVANNIKMQIETLKTRKAEIENMYNEKIDKFNEKVKKKLDIEVQKQMKKEVREVLSKEIKPLLEGSETWQDKNKGIWYSRETAQRNIYDIIPNKEHADLINKTIFDPIQEHQANKTRATNELFEKINSLNLDKKKKYIYTENEDGKMIKLPTKNATTYKIDEATLAQLYIEKKVTEEDLKKYGVNVDKIKNTAQTFTEILDSLYEQMNETVVEYGYSPIEKRENYFPHFTENRPDTIIGKVASLFGIDTTNQELPTEIAGRTENFKPGRTWNSNLLQRKSDKTDYDALKVLEKYIVGAEDIIHTTGDIQKLRQFSTELRYRYSEKGIQERIDEIKNNNELMPFEQEEAIENILSNKNNQLHQLSHFATWLDDYTNVLANKKNSGDREFEKNFNRNMYTTMSSIENRIASNTIGGNLSVSLTNIAPLAQAFGTTKTGNVIIGMLETTINDLQGFAGKKDTSFINNSDFLTNRFGTDRISKKKTSENVSDVLSTPMSAIDAFTAESIVRAKYRENLQEGMTEEDALKNADKYAKNLMGDRSKGALPVIFNNKNPMSKLITMFQVEPNNIVSNYLKDMPREAKNKPDLTWKASKLMASSYVFNTIIMAIRGGNEVLPDPIRFVTYLAKVLFGDDEDERKQAQTDMVEAIVGATPFASNLAGIFGIEDVGRVPISNAMPNIANMGTLFDDDVSDEYKKEMLIKEISKPLLYLGLPVGGAQLNKTIQGLATVQAGGSYKTNKEGERQLQFPVEKNIGNAIKAGIFGKYSLPSANQYIDSGFKSLNAEATKLYNETGIDYNILSDYINFSSESTVKDENEYSKYEDENGKVYWFDKNTQTMYDSDYKQTDIDRKILTKSSNKKQLVDYINDLNITDKQKIELYKYNIVSDVVNEDGISAQDEMDYMLKNGMSNKEYLQTYKKALDNNVTFPSQKTYDKLKEADLSVNKYLDYEKDVLDRKLEETKEKIASDSDENISVNQLEKMKILQDKKYSSKEKDAIYSTFIQSKAKEGKTTEYEDLKEYYANNSVLGSKNYRAYDIIEQYLDYKVNADNKIKELRANETKTENQKLSDEEKTQLLVDSKYTNSQTEALYVNVVASDTNKEKYEIVKQMNGGNKINTYLDYVLADKESDKEDDGTKNGKTISGTKKKKVVSAIQSTKLNEISKIYLLGTEYDLNTNTELSNYYKLKNYLKTQSESDQLRIVKTLKGKTEMKDGTYTW